MNKRIFTITMIIFAVSGLTMAQGTIEADGDGNTAYINQVGTVGNVASIRQAGDDNLATVDQDSTGTSGGPNPNYVKSYHNVFSKAGGVANRGINQFGNLNTASVVQKAKNGNASITQDGNENSAAVNQEALVNGYNTGLIYQKGNSNSATIDQIGGNVARTYQTGGNSNTASISQEGFGNGPDPLLNCPLIPDWSPLAAFDIAVFNYGTTRIGVTQYQEGNGNYASINVLGNDNNTAQWQQGDDNYATIDITGDGNQAKQVQLSSGDTATINIFGNNNQAGTYQAIGGQTATITLTGDGNNAYVVQTP